MFAIIFFGALLIFDGILIANGEYSLLGVPYLRIVALAVNASVVTYASMRKFS